MPLVQVLYKSQGVQQADLAELRMRLPRVVASALNTPENAEGVLWADHIDILMRKEAMSDSLNTSLGIIIWANDFPERRTNLEERQKTILTKLEEFLSPNLTFYVWVMLVPASFGKRFGRFPLSGRNPGCCDDH